MFIHYVRQRGFVFTGGQIVYSFNFLSGGGGVAEDASPQHAKILDPAG